MIRIFRTGDSLSIFRIEQANEDIKIFTKKELIKLIESPTVQCYVAEEGNYIVGYMLYTWTKTYYNIITLKTLPAYFYKSHETELLNKLKDRLIDSSRNRIVFYVPTNDTHMSNVLAVNKFRAFGESDGYLCFKYCLAFDYKYVEKTEN